MYLYQFLRHLQYHQQIFKIFMNNFHYSVPFSNKLVSIFDSSVNADVTASKIPDPYNVDFDKSTTYPLFFFVFVF